MAFIFVNLRRVKESIAGVDGGLDGDRHLGSVDFEETEADAWHRNAVVKSHVRIHLSGYQKATTLDVSLHVSLGSFPL